MYSRWFNVAVVLLWLSTMGWLLVEKVLPPLRLGDRPDYAAILGDEGKHAPIGWRLSINDQPVGWALSTTHIQPSGLSEIESLVHFDRLPLSEFVPLGLRSLLGMVDGAALNQPMEAASTLAIDPLHRLSRFESSVRLGDGDELVRLRGNLEGSHADLTIHSGDFLYRTSVPVPPDALMSDAFSPQTRLPNLRTGQTWTAPSFSPLLPPNSPVEIMHARVVGIEPLSFQGEVEQVWLVVYQEDEGAVLGQEHDARGRLWVRRDGTVLRQEMRLFSSTLSFVRLPAKEARALYTEAERRRLERESKRRWPYMGEPSDEAPSPPVGDSFAEPPAPGPAPSSTGGP